MLYAPAELGTSGFRQELLQAAADEAASQAAKKAASSAIASSTSAAAGDRSTGSLRDASDSGDPPAGSGVSFSAASASLRDLLKYVATSLCVFVCYKVDSVMSCLLTLIVEVAVCCLNPQAKLGTLPMSY